MIRMHAAQRTIHLHVDLLAEARVQFRTNEGKPRLTSDIPHRCACIIAQDDKAEGKSTTLQKTLPS